MKTMTKKTLLWLACYGFFGLMAVLAEIDSEDRSWALNQKDKTDDYLFLDVPDIGISSVKLKFKKPSSRPKPSTYYSECAILYKKSKDDLRPTEVKYDFSQDEVVIEFLDSSELYDFRPRCVDLYGVGYIGLASRVVTASRPNNKKLTKTPDGLVDYRFEYTEKKPYSLRFSMTYEEGGETYTEYLECYRKTDLACDSEGNIKIDSISTIDGRETCNPTDGLAKASPNRTYSLNVEDFNGEAVMLPISSNDIEQSEFIKFPKKSEKSGEKIDEVDESIKESLEVLFDDRDDITDVALEEFGKSLEALSKLKIDRKKLLKMIDMFSTKFIGKIYTKTLNSFIGE